MKQADVSIGLINPKSPDNVASIMRAAGNFQVDQVLYTGTRFARALHYRNPSVNMARKVSQGIPLSGVPCLISEAAETVKIICIELVEDAIPLPSFIHPPHALYIFGPEDGSISQEVIDRADAVTYIPTVSCMNLAATVNVVLYDRSAKLSQRQEGNAFIRANRDVNNRLRPKPRHITPTQEA